MFCSRLTNKLKNVGLIILIPFIMEDTKNI